MLKKQLLLIAAFLFLGSSFCIAQLNDSIFKSIKAKYRHIHNNLKSYDTTEVDIWGESTEGGQATAYYDAKGIKLIEGIWFGETGKRTIEYYFDDGKLFFVLDADYHYNRPIYWDKKTAKESNDNETFDPKKTVVKENRYYFFNQKLIRWLDNNKKEVDLSLPANTTVGQELIDDAIKQKAKFNLH